MNCDWLNGLTPAPGPGVPEEEGAVDADAEGTDETLRPANSPLTLSACDLSDAETLDRVPLCVAVADVCECCIADCIGATLI